MQQSLSYKDIKVYKKPWITNLPFIKEAKGFALFGVIYLRADFFNRFKSGIEDYETLSVLEHELRHIKNGKQKGFLKEHLTYWSSPKIRFSEEMSAIEEEMKIYKRYKKEFDIKKKAHYLSSAYYLWSVSYSKAIKRLNKLWNSL